MKYFILILLLLSSISCQQNKPTQEQLGVVRLDVSGKAKAIPHFEKGLLLLHSFEYEDAREAFLKAQELDPEMPMAYWGEAMTYNHSLWSEQDYEDGINALAPLEELDLNATATALERDFIQAVSMLYASNTTKTERDVAYSEIMAAMNKKYPKNHEVSAFYALSLLGSSTDGRDNELYAKGAVIAQGVLAENPKHPGALHYLIHSYDDPGHATLGLDAANAYSKVAPDASHALHMPSHIYVAMGMWDEVIASNISSYQASLNRMERKKLDDDARGYHAYHWLEYGYLQKGNTAEARQMVLEMEKFVKAKPSQRARVHLVFLKGTYLVESDDWQSEIANIPVDLTDLNISVRSQYQFLEGMKAYHAGDLAQLDRLIASMDSESQKATFVASNSRAKLCSGATRGDITNSDITEAQIRSYQLKGVRAALAQNDAEAEAHFLKSVELQESISYSYGPPHIQKPTRELYGDWLLSRNRGEEAAAQYERSLITGPKRRLALQGIEKANNI